MRQIASTPRLTRKIRPATARRTSTLPPPAAAGPTSRIVLVHHLVGPWERVFDPLLDSDLARVDSIPLGVEDLLLGRHPLRWEAAAVGIVIHRFQEVLFVLGRFRVSEVLHRDAAARRNSAAALPEDCLPLVAHTELDPLPSGFLILGLR